MAGDLFRKQAVDHVTRGRLDGSVVLAVPLSVRLLGLLAALIVAGVTLFAATASYARRETAPGWLTPDQGVLRAAVVQGGRVEALLVQEGDLVAAGQPLARLAIDAELEDGDAGTRILAALESQAVAARQAAEAEIARIEREAERRRASLDGLQRERRGVTEQISLQREEIALAQGQIDRAETLAARGFLSERELDDRRQRLLAARQSMALLERTRAGLERQMSDAEAAIQSAPLEIEEARARASATAASLDERLTQQSLRTAYVVVASAPARVAALPARPGQTLTAGAPVAVLVPEGGHLVAELYLPTRAVGFIEPGQEVRLRVEAFPHQRFGTVSARVTAVSRTVLAPSEAAIPGLAIQEPVFRVEAALDHELIEAYGQALPLQPGLMVSADIVIDRRNLIEWLFDPLFAAGRRG